MFSFFVLPDPYLPQAAKESGGGGKEGEKAVFTLYHDGSVNSKSYQMAEIEQRLSNLENVLGPPPENAAVGDMMRSVEFLTKRLDLLSDENRMEQLVRRAKTLKQALSDIQSNFKTTMEDQITKTKEPKINKMFEIMERWDSSAQALPAIVQRLTDLKNLHHVSFTSSFNTLLFSTGPLT